MNHERMYYRTSDGSMIMDFVFMDCGHDIGRRAYIIGDIDYGGRDTSGHATHRNLFEGDTYPCVCWRGRVDTLDEMKAVAALWSDATALYIKNGGDFDEIVKQLSEE